MRVPIYYVQYGPITGRIIQSGNVFTDEELELQKGPVARSPERIEDPELFYYNLADEEVQARPTFPGVIDKTAIVPDGEDTATISGIPDKCIVKINNKEITVEAGILKLKSNFAGAFTISTEYWPYLPWSVTVEATHGISS